MEGLLTKKLLLNENLCSSILPYYGKRLQCAELFGRLCQETKMFWEDNIFIFLFSILRDQKFESDLYLNDLFDERFYKFLKKNKYLMLYCRLHCKAQIADNYKWLLELISFAKEVEEDLNSKYKKSLKEESKETVGHRPFRANFAQIECFVTLKSAGTYYEFVQSYLANGYDFDLINTTLNIISMHQGNAKKELPEEISYLENIEHSRYKISLNEMKEFKQEAREVENFYKFKQLRVTIKDFNEEEEELIEILEYTRKMFANAEEITWIIHHLYILESIRHFITDFESKTIHFKFQHEKVPVYRREAFELEIEEKEQFAVKLYDPIYDRAYKIKTNKLYLKAHLPLIFFQDDQAVIPVSSDLSFTNPSIEEAKFKIDDMPASSLYETSSHFTDNVCIVVKAPQLLASQHYFTTNCQLLSWKISSLYYCGLDEIMGIKNDPKAILLFKPEPIAKKPRFNNLLLHRFDSEPEPEPISISTTLDYCKENKIPISLRCLWTPPEDKLSVIRKAFECRITEFSYGLSFYDFQTPREPATSAEYSGTSQHQEMLQSFIDVLCESLSKNNTLLRLEFATDFKIKTYKVTEMSQYEQIFNSLEKNYTIREINLEGGIKTDHYIDQMALEFMKKRPGVDIMLYSDHPALSNQRKALLKNL
ncbi:unnamed protein product [Moneuplotes crassus]|uniref:Uncharacterized protein n=1 Tax=Euplotes crassus TaxID=5936 RepID=A0AAD1U1Z1_EUPCR|nr:unnamed protein product [Moneuplotes crassus]